MKRAFAFLGGGHEISMASCLIPAAAACARGEDNKAAYEVCLAAARKGPEVPYDLDGSFRVTY